jgi:predicted secreted hydrolase
MRNKTKKGVLVAVLITVISVVILLSLRVSEPGPEVTTPVSGSSRLSELLSDAGREGYAQAIDSRRFEFPADHGPHPDFRNEWWYVTGNLDSDTGRRFGFELTIFRFSLTPRAAEAAASTSAWRSNQVYIGHFALTDSDTQQFHVAQRFSRGSLGLAGAAADPFRVWLDDWSITGTRSSGPVVAEYKFGLPWRLQAGDGEIALNLTLTPRKAPVLNGVDGLSQKAAEEGNASYYYSITRLQTDGRIVIGDEEFLVSGLSWLDREWGSSALSAEQQGWDWYALQLSDGSDLMFYNLRRNDGSQDIHSAGTLTLQDGSSVYLSRDDLEIEVLDTWDSPHGGQYPMAWRISVPQHELSLQVDPILDAQELVTTVRYWEGAVDVTGERGTTPIIGRGYVELTGYADRDMLR